MKPIDTTLEALADPARRRVVELLRVRPYRAGELGTAAQLSGPAMSRHLPILRSSGLVEAREDERDARVRVYRLRRQRFADLQAWLDQVQAFWSEQLTAYKARAEQGRNE